MKFIASEYGDQLHTAVLHLDESHPHVHFYVIPRDYEMAAACRGDRASKETGKKLEAKKAMQSYQDDYFSQVSVQCGHEIRPTPPAPDPRRVEGATGVRY